MPAAPSLFLDSNCDAFRDQVFAPWLVLLVAENQLQGVFTGGKIDHCLSLAVHVMQVVVIKRDEIIHRLRFRHVYKQVMMT